MEEKTDWVSPGVKEVPYWRDGMSPEEYEMEREYYYTHLEYVKKGDYKPLWKQKKKEGRVINLCSTL